MKRLILGAMHNVRDLGGYPTPFGYTKALRFLRSDMPKELKDPDLDFLRKEGITTIIDLRNRFERTDHPHPLQGQTGFFYHSCPMFADGVIPQAPEEMAPAYLRLATTPETARPVWQVIAGAPDGVLFHCTAGKDRTGVVAALLLWMAGVSKADILADYLVTQAYVLDPYRRMMQNNPDFPYFLTKADLSYIEAFFDAFVEQFADPAEYLQAMGLSDNVLTRIRQKLLY